MNKIKEDAINLHRALRGKIEIHNRVSIDAGFGNHEEYRDEPFPHFYENTDFSVESIKNSIKDGKRVLLNNHCVCRRPRA